MSTMKKQFQLMKTTSKVAVVISCMMLSTSCDKELSSVTAWEYNQPDNGGFEVLPYDEQETGPGLILVEGGTFTMGRVEQDVTYDWNNIPRRVTVSSFYIDEVETRNLDYLEYLWWTSRVLSPNFPEVYNRALPDTLVWREKLAYNEPYVEYYLRHPSFRDYPVVGVNWIQANNFCAWRTDRVNEFIMIREGLIEHNPSATEADYFNTDQYLAGKWTGPILVNMPSIDPNGSGERILRMEDGIFLPRYRLPTEAEWEYAAYGLIGNTIGERVNERRLYSWNGHGVRNADSKYLGQILANFKRGAGDNMGVAGYLNDNADVPAPVYAYWPNDYGLYCMNGNVSEWVMDVYRPLSPEDKDDFRPFRGNVFKTKLKDDEGIVINTDSVIFDKDSNLINVPGMVKWRDVSVAYNEDNLDERRNYKYADNINYIDGDVQSQAVANWTDAAPPEGKPVSSGMYNAPIKPDDKDGSLTSLVNDKARVYKGGSWRDRAYWLVPGTRRFLDQRQSTSYIGFRCAMDRVGSPVGMGRTVF